MRLSSLSIIVLGVLAATAGIRSDKTVAAPPVAIEVVNDAGKTFTFTAADLEKLPQKEVAAKDHNGDHAKYAGVLVADLLKRAEVTSGEQLRGKLLSNHLLIEAKDKYRVVTRLRLGQKGLAGKCLMGGRARCRVPQKSVCKGAL